jgi:hypothetical protein
MTEPAKPAKKRRFLTSGKALAILAGVAILIWARVSYIPSQPEKEPKAQNERFRSKRAPEVAKADRDRNLCHIALICRHFGGARRACAVAGDFNDCMRVKFGEKDLDTTSRCSSDGRIVDEPSDMPNRLQCAEFDAGD